MTGLSTQAIEITNMVKVESTNVFLKVISDSRAGSLLHCYISVPHAGRAAGSWTHTPRGLEWNQVLPLSRSSSSY